MKSLSSLLKVENKLNKQNSFDEINPKFKIQLSIYYTELSSMKQPSHSSKAKSPFSPHDPVSTAEKQPKPSHLGPIYICYKYTTIFILIAFVTFACINILGDTSFEVRADRGIFDVYKGSESFVSQVESIWGLFQKKGSKYVSSNVVNLYSNDHISQQTQQSQHSNNQFAALVHFSDFLISQQYPHKNVLYLPLNLNNNSQFLQESYSSKILNYLKRSVEKLLKKFKISQPNSVKQLKWNRVKRLVENGKVDDLLQLVNNNIISTIWSWARSSPQVIILTASQPHSPNQLSPKQKKSLKKFLRQHDQSNQIILLTKYPINKLYDTKEDGLKAYHVENFTLQNVNNSGLCKYLEKEMGVKEQEKCLAVKAKFGQLGQLERFVEDYEVETNVAEEQSQECVKLLDKVCLNGHVKHYFYDNQDNANKAAKKSKKNTIWSHLKKSISLNKIKDIYLTLTSEEPTMSLRDMNQIGLVYDFELHELKWRGEKERLEYEIRNDKVCKNGKVVVQEMDQEVKENKKVQQAEQEKAEQQQEKAKQQQEKAKQQQQKEEVKQQQKVQQAETADQQHPPVTQEQPTQQVSNQQHQQQQQEVAEQQQQQDENNQQQNKVDDTQEQQQVADEGQQKVTEDQQQEQQAIAEEQQQQQAEQQQQIVDEKGEQEQQDQGQEQQQQVQEEVDQSNFIQEVDISQINLEEDDKEGEQQSENAQAADEGQEQQQPNEQQVDPQEQQQPQQDNQGQVELQEIPQSPQQPIPQVQSE